MASVSEVSRRNIVDVDEVKVVDDSNQQLHVLAVDDSLIDRKVIERLLKISSCKVTAVESGRSALQYLGLEGENTTSLHFNGLKVNLIMTDYSMPGMTGYELLKKIKESSAFKEIPVVIMSSENILARIDSCLKEGAEEYLVKPVKLSDVKRLKDVIMKGEDEENIGNKMGRKRKLQHGSESFDNPSSTPSSPPPTFSHCQGIVQLSPSSPSLIKCSSKKPRLLNAEESKLKPYAI